MQTASSVLPHITLQQFKRTQHDRQTQTFHFTFLYKGKTYTLHHTFEHHGQGTNHSFRLQTPWFARKPFILSQEESLILSNDLMEIRNKQEK